MRKFRVKVANVKPKEPKVVYLNPNRDFQSRMRRLVGDTIDDAVSWSAKQGSDVAGYAMVIWNVDGGSNACCQVRDSSKIPAILVPDFVRNRLLAGRIEEWTMDSVKDMLWGPQKGS